MTMINTHSLHDYLSPTSEIIEEARAGRMFILVDDEDRENEGDLVIPAQFATTEAINFMARHARGLICLAMTRGRVDQLGLSLMSAHNRSRHASAFTVSIEARHGIRTGPARSRSPSIPRTRGRRSRRPAISSPSPPAMAGRWCAPAIPRRPWTSPVSPASTPLASSAR